MTDRHLSRYIRKKCEKIVITDILLAQLFGSIFSQTQGDRNMKYDCSTEFDLEKIYAKLTAPVKCPTVAAKDFFDGDDYTLRKFRIRLEQAIAQETLAEIACVRR